MGKCIVCNKFAGPFYSLHKTCYQVYEDTREDLHDAFSKSIKSFTPESKLVDTVRECRPPSSFSLRLFESLIVREWQDRALQVVKSKTPNGEQANYLLQIAQTFNIEDRDVEPHLFTRLSNVEHIERIQQEPSISGLYSGSQAEVELENDEFLIWMIDEVLEVEQQRNSTNANWTIWQSIIVSLFKKSRYNELETKVEATGKLVITNKNLCYVTNKDTSKIAYAEIYSVTPMKDGIRIQTSRRDSTPNTYITGDGRFIYTLLNYAQEQKG